MSKLSDQTPVEIDTQIAEINAKMSRPRSRFDSAQDTIERFLAEDNETRTPVYTRVSEYDYQRAQDRQAEAIEELRPLEQQLHPLHNEYNARRWTRFFHVTNTNGHVHTSMHCSTTFPDTQYSWRTDLSGKTEEEVVASEAHWACSVCMPIAPADQKAAFKAYQEQKRADKAAEKAQKAAEKAAKKLAREESLAHKVNKALDKYSADEIQQAWYDGKITDSVYDVIFDMGKANERKY